MKNGEERIVHLSDDAFGAIAEGIGDRRSGYVFNDEKGDVMTQCILPCRSGGFVPAFKSALISKARRRAPSLRLIASRGFATRGVRTGDLRSTQELLGHAISQMTQEIYAEPELDTMRDTVRAIQARMGSRRLFNNNRKTKEVEIIAISSPASGSAR